MYHRDGAALDLWQSKRLEPIFCTKILESLRYFRWRSDELLMNIYTANSLSRQEFNRTTNFDLRLESLCSFRVKENIFWFSRRSYGQLFVVRRGWSINPLKLPLISLKGSFLRTEAMRIASLVHPSFVCKRKGSWNVCLIVRTVPL